MHRLRQLCNSNRCAFYVCSFFKIWYRNLLNCKGVRFAGERMTGTYAGETMQGEDEIVRS